MPVNFAELTFDETEAVAIEALSRLPYARQCHVIQEVIHSSNYPTLIDALQDAVDADDDDDDVA